MEKEKMIEEVKDVLRKMYYEDVEFFYKFVTGFAEKKGIK
jgi:hypothetical protein